METLLQDLRYGIRMLMKRPGVTAVAVVALALGIGANSAIFSVVNTVLLRALPYSDPDRLMMVKETNLPRGEADVGVSTPDFREWRDRNQVFELMAAYAPRNFNISGGGEPERVRGVVTSTDLFGLLGVNPAQGRTFRPEEEQFGNHRVVVLSHGLWQRRFGADPGLVGQPITLNGEKFSVIGIMPAGFQFPDKKAALWTPLAFAPDDSYNTRGNYWLNVIARLKPGVTKAQAQSDMKSVAERIESEFKENGGMGASVVSLREDTVRNVESALVLLLTAVAFVLLIACANVANLLLARSASRQKEIAIRTSLGANRSRVVRQLLTESLLLALAGGTLGLLLALWGVDVLVSLSPEDLPRLNEIKIDSGVLIFTLGLSLLTSLIFGLAPALQTSKPDLNESLKEGSRGSTTGVGSRRVRGMLVVAEVAIALVVLICAGLMINSFMRLRNVSPGFKTDNILTLSIALPESRYPDSHAERSSAFFQELIGQVRALPGVEAAAVSSSIPFSGGGWGKLFSVEGRPYPTSLEDMPVIQYRQLSNDYFQTMGIPVARGRAFNDQDTSESVRVAVINETLARRFFAEEDPIGKRVFMGPPEEIMPPGLLPPGFRFQRYTVIGVVSDVKHDGLDQPVRPEAYTLHAQGGDERTRTMYVAVRTNSDPSNLVAAVRSQVLNIDKDQPIANVMTMEKRLSDSFSQQRFITLLLGVFAGVALILAGVGLYGVMSYSVTQRTHEIGIRMALGARASDVLRMVVSQGLRLTALGICIGLAGALLLTRLMRSLLFGVSATDPLTFAAISLLLTGVALVACFVPARRATKVDPMVALRYE
ncbi:MAG TPA: ABC transporter permease [Blastocatellia bacterium]|jgi:putative ABC transport system permease protein|nr:ABC transporter permease [Blastocatellia bacterium]